MNVNNGSSDCYYASAALYYVESGLFKIDKKEKLSSDNFVFLCYNTCEFTEYIVNNIQKGELLHEIS